ncbi:MAG: tetratricopeptide repeat protein [Anaerolineae bacterium]|nr:tetratricopeptide repeat protein [Anaerolineae bacterium]
MASAPTALLYTEQASPLVQRLLSYCRSALREQRWEHAQLCAQDAIAFCQESGDHTGEALALLHLADFYGDVGELGEALEHCARAYQLLRRQAAPLQRHNEAVVAYALGLLTELQPVGFIAALSWYQDAITLFGTARESWATLNDGSKVKLCDELRIEIEKRIEHMLQSRLKHPWRAAFDIWTWDSPESPFHRDRESRGYVQDDGSVLIGGDVYYSDKKLEFDKAYYYFALPAGELAPVLKVSASSFLLFRQQWKAQQEGAGIVWQRGSGWVAVEFRRERDGFRFYPRRPVILGDEKPIPGDAGAMLKGYAVALLKKPGE